MRDLEPAAAGGALSSRAQQSVLALRSNPSDLKHVKQPLWIDPSRGNPQLMLYSVVDDRSGVDYEYHCVYGEDVEAALRFMFNAMSPKPVETFPFQGIPDMI